jgi:acyl-CoA dehydrogenase family member 9
MHDESFVRSLFFGLVNESRVFPWPERARAEIDTVHSIDDRLRRLFEWSSDAEVAGRAPDDPRAPEETIARLKELGCFGTLVPQAYGGLGLSRAAHLRVLQEAARIDSNVASTLLAHHLGIKTLLLFGTESQKSRYLPPLARGDRLAAFALAETRTDGHAPGIATHAERQTDGGYVLTGSKICPAGCGLADLFVVFARTSMAEEGVKPKISAFFVERGPDMRSTACSPGARSGAMTELVLNGVRVAPENVCGEPGKGFRVAMQALSSGRLELASRCIGVCKRAIRLSVNRCTSRRSFGRPIGELGLVQDRIATMVSDTWALESITYLTAGALDSQVDALPIESAICKVFGDEACFRIAHETAQIAAVAESACDGPCERLVADAGATLVFDESNDVVRSFIALSGMQGPGRDLADAARAAREPVRSFGLLGELVIRRARKTLARPQMTRHAGALDREARVFDRYVVALARGVEKLLRRHGRDIAELQYSQKRIADMAIHLYAIAACIVRTTHAIERRGEDGARREIDLTRIFAHAAASRLAGLSAAMDRNDDDLRKLVSNKTFADGSYPFDVV